MCWFRKPKPIGMQPVGTQPVLDGVKQLYICPTCGGKAEDFPNKCDICGRMLCSNCNKALYVCGEYAFEPHFCPSCFKKLNKIIEKWKGEENVLVKKEKFLIPTEKEAKLEENRLLDLLWELQKKHSVTRFDHYDAIFCGLVDLYPGLKEHPKIRAFEERLGKYKAEAEKLRLIQQEATEEDKKSEF